jgi:predicted RecA/RadA family phage recombinase
MAQTPCLKYKEGRVIDYTPESALTAGDVVLLGTIPMIASADTAAGTKGTLECEGIWKVPQAAEIITAGDAVYWDADGNPYGGTAGSGAGTGTATGNNLMGVAVFTTAATDTYVYVKLTAAKRTTTIAGSVTADDITGSDSSLAIAGLSAAQGGAVAIAGGTSSTAGNAGGAVTITGGTPGVTGAGGAVTITGKAGGSTSGTGGAVAIAGGAGTAGNANGGAVSILGGNAHGSGTDGAITIGTSNTASITIAAASIATAVAGPLTLSVGASTEAAGSTNADAAALPAGTASVYPTSAADDTKGVVINAADKVTGRILFILNGVSNKILKVYPPSGGTINGAAADAAFSSASGKGVTIVCVDSATNAWMAS